MPSIMIESVNSLNCISWHMDNKKVSLKYSLPLLHVVPVFCTSCKSVKMEVKSDFLRHINMQPDVKCITISVVILLDIFDDDNM